MPPQKLLWLAIAYTFHACLLASVIKAKAKATAALPKGALPSLASNYDSNRPFRCLDGSATIDFSSVNDNYCDCSDGSDEPGTSACPNGRFHCLNAGYKPLTFPSSRVNDGICDCCDGTDEYDGKISCQNTCDEVGAKYREELKKLQEEAEKGYAMRLQYIKEGLEAKEKNKAKLQSLKANIEPVRQKTSELEAIKNEAENLEKQHLDAFEKKWEETKSAKRDEYYKTKSIGVFNDLDSNKDGSITIDEIISNHVFDADGNGEVSEEEAKEIVGEAGTISNYDNFMANVWPKWNDKLVKIKSESSDTGKISTEQQTPDVDEDNFDNDIVTEDEDEAAKEHVATTLEEDIYGQKPEHDEHLKSLIAAADKARQEHKASEDEKNNIENEIGEIEKALNSDFGSQEEFAYLLGKCFQFTDREYTYELCPFNKVTQSQKSGGSQTSLGSWGSWVGAENKYSKMKYEGGQNCWNGPDRSATIVMSCGTEDSLISASEPNRCEYLMELKTPAACSSKGDKSSHDEL